MHPVHTSFRGKEPIHQFCRFFSLTVFMLFSLLATTNPSPAQQWRSGEGNLFVDPPNTPVGIGTEAPQTNLDVEGTIRMSGFQLVYGGSEPQPGMVLTRDEEGGGTWQAIPFRWQQSGNNIYYNQGNVGIGVTSPGSKLSVNGEIEISGSRLHVGTDGKVGIGTGSPATDLHLYKSGGVGGVTALRLQYSIPSVESYSDWQLQASSEGKFLISEGVTPRLAVSAGGNVGIGTASPGNYKLAVNGAIRSKEIVVETGWSDFVFEDDYPLPSLSEVEQHIKAHKHLPGIPSAKEVEAHGVSLGQMQSKLLQKIEELTLYVIDLKKENEGLKERLVQLEKK